MMAVTPRTRVLAYTAPMDFRKGIDGLARVCRDALSEDPFSGTVFIFRNRRRTAIKLLAYDGQGFWLCQKRMSESRFRYWPGEGGALPKELAAHQLQVLLAGGDAEASAVRGAPIWKRLPPEGTDRT